MSIQNDCLYNAVGLSNTNCDCSTEDMPSDASYSESGLVLDELEGLNLEVIKNAADCNKGGLWDLMNKARQEGIHSFRSSVMSYVRERSVRKRNHFSGVIGSDSNTGMPVNISKSFCGISLKTAIVRGGFIRVKKIGLLFSTSAPLTLYLFDNISDTPLAAWNFNTVAGTPILVTLDEPIDLPMARDIVRNPQYWFVYAPSGSPRPLDNRITCGCGNLGALNVIYPYKQEIKGLQIPDALHNWMEWMYVNGCSGNNITEREKTWQYSNVAHGLMIEAEIVCNGNEVICSESLDYTDDLNMHKAIALRYFQGEKLIDMILSSSKPNRFTMSDREAMYGKRSHYRKEADTRAQYIARQLTSSDMINLTNDCLSCKNVHGFEKGGILVTG